MVCSPFPPPGIAAFSLPDTISAPPQSQRLTPFRTASPPLPFRNCHSEGIRQGPVLGLRWFLPEMPEEPQLQMFHRPYLRVRASSPPKNNSLRPHTAYNKVMRTSKHCLLSRVSSLLVVLCLLAAPLCATRCTFSSCADLSTHEQSTTGCHHQPNHSPNSSVLAGAIGPTCLPTDSLLTTLPAPPSRLLSADSDFHSLSTTLNSPSISEASVLIAFRISNSGSSPGDSGALLLNAPLRL